MIVGEYLIQAALTSAIREIRSQPSLTASFLGTLRQYSPAKYAQAEHWFSTSTNTISIIQGWPTEPPPISLAIAAITLSPQSEEGPPIGGDFVDESEFVGGDPTAQKVRQTNFMGTTSRSTHAITIYSANYDVLIWVSRAIYWALLRNRKGLEAAGMAVQNLTMQDIGPDSRFSEQYVFRRIVSVSHSQTDVVETSYTSFVKAIEVLMADPEDPGHPFLPND